MVLVQCASLHAAYVKSRHCRVNNFRVMQRKDCIMQKLRKGNNSKTINRVMVLAHCSCPHIALCVCEITPL